jgi:hypothetical protein
MSEDPTLTRQSAHRWRGCPPDTPATLHSQKYFLVPISVRGWVNTRATVRLEELGKLKKSNDLIETRTGKLPAWSIAPQPCMLLHATTTLLATSNSEKPYKPNKLHIVLFFMSLLWRKVIKERERERERESVCVCVSESVWVCARARLCV